MKHAVWVGLIVLMAGDAAAQRHGGGDGGAGRGAFRPGRFSPRTARGVNERFGPRSFGNFSPYGYPLFDDWYDFGYPDDSEYPYPPNNIAEPPMPPVVIRQGPPPPVRSVTHNYDASALAPPPAGTEQASFVIALNTGEQLAAMAVWTQDGVVHYIDPDGQSRQVPLRSVDRDLTRRLNDERNLNLRLPPPQ